MNVPYLIGSFLFIFQLILMRKFEIRRTKSLRTKKLLSTIKSSGYPTNFGGFETVPVDLQQPNSTHKQL